MLLGAFQPPTWGWKMITVHEKMYPFIKCVAQLIVLSGFGGRKAPSTNG
jgi:hypothetical protein